ENASQRPAPTRRAKTDRQVTPPRRQETRLTERRRTFERHPRRQPGVLLESRLTLAPVWH
ncbi:MAG: hypothetical protein ABR992_20110, partial [Solirubrobacteraceae bacterium]